MTALSPRPAGLVPSIVLPVFIEPLVKGRRVAMLGDASTALADELVARGARLVHSYDPDPARAAEVIARGAGASPKPISVSVLADDLGVRDGAFDVVVVPDLSVFTEAPDVMRRARKLVSPSGAAIFVAPNTRGEVRRLLPASRLSSSSRSRSPTYYELYDLASLQFSRVKMIGQAPFVGYTVADFAPNGEPDVSVDTSLLASSEEPEHFIAVASDRSIALEPFTVIELPWAEVADAIGVPDATPTPRGASSMAVPITEDRLAMANTELERLRAQKAEETREAEERAAREASLSARVAELTRDAALREQRLSEVEARAGDNHVRAERLTHQVREQEEELARQRDRATKLSKQLDDERRFRQKAELELGMIRGKPEIAGSKDRIAELTGDLDASRARITELSGELDAARARIATLSIELDAAETRITDLKEQRDAALSRTERLTSELDAARTRLAEFEIDSATTLRRGEAARPASPDTKLLYRLTELEAAVNAALREAADAASQRDAAIERARRAEVRAERAADLDSMLDIARREKADLLEHAGVLETRAAEAERRVAEERARVLEAERKAGALSAKLAADAEQRAEIAERRVTELEARVAQLTERSAAAEARAADLSAAASKSEAEAAAMQRELLALRGATGAMAQAFEEERKKLAIAREDLRAVEQGAAAEEIAALEQRLLDRGRRIAALEGEIVESRRTGRELLDELTALREGRPSLDDDADPVGLGTNDPVALRAKLDKLAESAARAEADLLAARWRVSQLERELSLRSSSGGGDPSIAQRELEQALAAAREEVALLRRAASV